MFKLAPLQLIVLISLLAFPALSTQLDAYDLTPLWSSWKQIYQKDYSLFQEESSRFSVFIENYKKITEFNANSGNHPNSLKLALNKFADLTEDEFRYVYTGGYLPPTTTHSYQNEANSNVDYSLLQLPSSVDWRRKGAVTPVKNQQQCGSCWSFATAAALESLYYLTTGKLLTFSEQQIVDCDTTDHGCNGGLPERAFEYTAQAGIETEADYPYSAANGRCQYDESKAIKVNTGHKLVTRNSVSALKAALVVQPVSVAIEADQRVFQFYKSGVIKASAGCGGYLDHAVLAVGYTTLEGGDEAFIVKNSWGSDWGADGYVHISTEEGANSGKGVCGILGDAVVPIA